MSVAAVSPRAVMPPMAKSAEARGYSAAEVLSMSYRLEVFRVDAARDSAEMVEF